MFTSLRRAGTRFAARSITTKPSEYGQPTFLSHPHLVKENETTPGIPASDYEQRRRRLMELLPEKSVVLSVAAPVKYMSANIFYKYRQASDFWYLTGFEEPESAVVLEKNSSSKGYSMTLFCSGRNFAKEKWDGARTSLSSAKNLFHADETMPISSFASHLKAILPTSSHVYVDLPNPTFWSSRQKGKGLLNYLTGSVSSLNPMGGVDKEEVMKYLSGSAQRPLAPQVGKLRVLKSKAEQEVMKAAADISAKAHTKTMLFTQPGKPESAVAGHFEYLCTLGGSQRPAYVPVVASGPNSLILHYTANDHVIRNDELVLIDAGCEYNGYASDITRTFPASGTFTSAQQEIYSAVLHTQKEMIKLCTETSGYSLQELHKQSCELLRAELNRIGFELKGEGVDLHESTFFERAAPLRQGMVITIEPGIYVPPTANFPKHFHNIGVRIEDDVLVGEEHPTILSVAAPKEVVDVEGACQGLLGLEPY
ncbi:hypothetical protein NLJ89_g7287 [Agrocybe chaxingu]|uniref:Aminopeptidase P N-terminal domain-containing protein n=1 Tax=Agrocybe chaxingu TaxID=84603 RepID=A0A9W8K3X2_9AGAR|nr:hypothetical protein NLJ89_g7287 [Agrocybe chaxingu]